MLFLFVKSGRDPLLLRQLGVCDFGGRRALLVGTLDVQGVELPTAAEVELQGRRAVRALVLPSHLVLQTIEVDRVLALEAVDDEEGVLAGPFALPDGADGLFPHVEVDAAAVGALAVLEYFVAVVAAVGKAEAELLPGGGAVALGAGHVEPGLFAVAALDPFPNLQLVDVVVG